MTTPASTAHPRPLSLTITPTTSTSLLPSLAHLHRLAFASTALAQALNARVAPSALEAWRAADMATYMHPYHVARGKTVVVATFGELGGLGEAGGLGELGGTGVGELVGYAVWDEVRPERVLSREEAELERPEGPGLPEGMERELAGDYFGRMAERRKAFSGDRFRKSCMRCFVARERPQSGPAGLDCIIRNKPAYLGLDDC